MRSITDSAAATLIGSWWSLDSRRVPSSREILQSKLASRQINSFPYRSYRSHCTKTLTFFDRLYHLRKHCFDALDYSSSTAVAVRAGRVHRAASALCNVSSALLIRVAPLFSSLLDSVLWQVKSNNNKTVNNATTTTKLSWPWDLWWW